MDTRIHGTTKRQVATMFADEKPALGELPLEPFRYYQYWERTVNLDGCGEVEAANHGAPPGGRGQRADRARLHAASDNQTAELVKTAEVRSKPALFFRSYEHT